MFIFGFFTQDGAALVLGYFRSSRWDWGDTGKMEGMGFSFITRTIEDWGGSWGHMFHLSYFFQCAAA